MIFHETDLADARLIAMEIRGDERGFFSRAWCRIEFEEAGLSTRIEQANMSGSVRRGTLRGLHFQLDPAAEVKIVRCIRGTIFDVIVDLRADSPTFMQWQGFELSARNRRVLYVPEGFAHGFQSLTDDAELFYMVSALYTPERERGLRWDDPRLGISWPLEPTVMSDKDRNWPLLQGDADFGFCRRIQRKAAGDAA